MAACHRLSSNRFAAFADSLKSKTWTSVYASSILHCTHAAPTEFQNRASPIEEACDNRRQTVHFYEVLDRADLRSRSIAAHTIFQESLTGEFAWETERSSYQIRHCRCKKKREGLRANITKRERERKENLDVRGTGIFVECVSRITGSYQYALIPRYMKKLERIRIGYTVTLFTRRESRIGDRYEIKKKRESWSKKYRGSSVSSSFFIQVTINLKSWSMKLDTYLSK